LHSREYPYHFELSADKFVIFQSLYYEIYYVTGIIFTSSKTIPGAGWLRSHPYHQAGSARQAGNGDLLKRAKNFRTGASVRSLRKAYPDWRATRTGTAIIRKNRANEPATHGEDEIDNGRHCRRQKAANGRRHPA
jgi:hypothetical protein